MQSEKFKDILHPFTNVTKDIQMEHSGNKHVLQNCQPYMTEWLDIPEFMIVAPLLTLLSLSSVSTSLLVFVAAVWPANILNYTMIAFNACIKGPAHEPKKRQQNIAWQKPVATQVKKIKIQSCFPFAIANRITTFSTLRSCNKEKKKL